ncbi:MAG: hypothetical protein NTX28_06175 [Novosphingobium sp.]|nr:hypothetical protein [Novosphingobium sp.]
MAISLLAENPAGWAQHSFDELLRLPREEREALQLAALKLRFARMREKVPALQTLAAKQGVESIEKISDVLPVCFDHRVLKNYPLSILENRDFKRLTSWLNKLTMHDLLKVDLEGLSTIDGWLDRLTDYGMLIGTSSGTTGKLSFVPRSRDELSSWRASYLAVNYASSGVDSEKVKLPMFSAVYRGGHQMMLKIQSLFAADMAGGEEHWHTLYSGTMPADLMALSGKLQAAEERGEIEQLGLDPALLEQRTLILEQGRRKEADMEAWFGKLVEEFRGHRVKIGAPFAELYRLAKAGTEKGLKPSFAEGSVLMGGGGMKGYKDAPDNWEEIITDFFGIPKISNMYGFSECIGHMPMCDHGFFHFFPYAIPLVLDADATELPREGVQTGRLAVVDLLAETYWGGFISGDEVTMHWDEQCPCGWGGPRIEKNVRRYSEAEGGDDKITCAGSAQAYNEFMDFVAGEA